MIIKRNDVLSVEFSELRSGEVFIEEMDCGDIIQMKIIPIEDNYGDVLNAIILETGEACRVPSKTMVRKVEAELIIR